jgi:hypothetical protein
MLLYRLRCERPTHMDEEIRKALCGLTVPLWPTAGQALGLGREATYAGARRGDIPALRIGKKYVVPTPPLRRMLGLDEKAA